MSFHVGFSLSTGLSKPITVPKGHIAMLRKHIAEFEAALGLETEQYKDNPKHWKSKGKQCLDMDDDEFCSKVARHNSFVWHFYNDLARWSKKPPTNGEELTPEIAAEFWHGLETLAIPAERWSDEHYVEQMEELYETLRGRTVNEMTFDAKPLTPEQADSVINLISQWLDPGDNRLAVPRGQDRLVNGDEYVWCSECGAIDRDEARHTLQHCRKRCGKGGCRLREDYSIEEFD